MIEKLGEELKKQKEAMEKQEEGVGEMRKQILAYRKEIIELSTTKKAALKHRSKISESGMVPPLDLAKVVLDSDDNAQS